MVRNFLLLEKDKTKHPGIITFAYGGMIVYEEPLLDLFVPDIHPSFLLARFTRETTIRTDLGLPISEEHMRVCYYMTSTNYYDRLPMTKTEWEETQPWHRAGLGKRYLLTPEYNPFRRDPEMREKFFLHIAERIFEAFEEGLVSHPEYLVVKWGEEPYHEYKDEIDQLKQLVEAYKRSKGL